MQSGSFLIAAPFLSENDLGFLRAAERLALLVSFSVLAINPVITPRIVQFSRGGETVGLRRVTMRAGMASTGIGACVLLPLLIWPEQTLSLMGAEFGAAADYLRLMALTQFVAAMLGPLSPVLNMSGRERAAMWINVVALVLALGLIPLLCAEYGALGFAVAYSVVVVARLALVAAVVAAAGILSQPDATAAQR